MNHDTYLSRSASVSQSLPLHTKKRGPTMGVSSNKRCSPRARKRGSAPRRRRLLAPKLITGQAPSEQRRRNNSRPAWSVGGSWRVLRRWHVLRRASIWLLICRRNRLGRIVGRTVVRCFLGIFRMSRVMMNGMRLRLWPHKKILECIERTGTRRLRQNTCR